MEQGVNVNADWMQCGVMVVLTIDIIIPGPSFHCYGNSSCFLFSVPGTRYEDQVYKYLLRGSCSYRALCSRAGRYLSCAYHIPMTVPGTRFQVPGTVYAIMFVRGTTFFI